MTARFSRRRTLVALAALAATALVWQITLAKAPKTPPKQATKVATTETLGGADRYLTHLSTDKPIYRPEETLYVRGVILHHANRKPLANGARVTSLVEIEGPKGDVVASGFVPSQESVLGYSWAIPKGQAGGEYTIRVTYPGFGQPPAERTFDVRAYRPPRLKSQIEFLRDGYGPGDEVVATLEVERAEGGIPAGAKVTVIARVDGQEVFRGPSRVDDQGHCEARFPLPEKIERGEGTLAMVIEDGGIVETASKTIPILLQTVDLTMYPEGGELVAGLPNRVYFEAFTPSKKPADLAGVILDDTGRKVAEFRSEHEGRGRFKFWPKKAGQYSLRITEPAGIKTLFPLPKVKPAGVVIHSAKDVYEPGEPIELEIGTVSSHDAVVTLSQREKELATAKLPLRSRGPFQPLESIRLKVPDSADGVLIATVWDAEGNPLAERLIFRRPTKSINVQITADASQYVPGDDAKLTITTTDDTGEPVSAVVGVTVTDDSVLEMIEKRDQAPRLPVMVLLEDDVKELADAHVYLDPENADAPLAVDLLLGTQGWRRFAFVDTAKFIAEHDDNARRALALRMVSRERLMEVASGMAVDGAIEVLKGAAPPPMAVPQGAAAPPPDMAPEEPAAEPPAGPAAPPPAREPVAADQPVAAEEPEEEAPAERPVASAPVLALEQMSKKRQKLDRALDMARDRKSERALLRQDRLEIRNDFVPVRIFAHQVRSGRRPGERVDFAETLFWNAAVKTDKKGQATVEFGLNDSVTSFRVFTDAFDAGGTLGTGSIQIESVEPFYLEPKLPLEVTSGDEIKLPLGVVNATGTSLVDGKIEATGHESLQIESPVMPLSLQPLARIRKMMAIQVGPHNGPAEFTLTANAGPYADKVTRKLMVKPQGFPIEEGFGGLLVPGGTVSNDIKIPAELVPGSITTKAVVYPTPLANLTEALARLIREPYGCFEQTSSTTYPLVMAQQYFMSHQGIDPELVRRSNEALARGYDRLVGFECKSQGYEWFAADPGHEALTAYGLLEFTDMAQVREVDAAMLERTTKWLLGTRDGKGGFSRARRALHTWIVDAECANAYITWALLETGTKEDLSSEVDWIRKAAEKSDNTYVVALGANVLGLAGDTDGANRLLDKLAGKQTDDGSLKDATTSIVGSGGESLKIETTSLALLAWLKNPRYAANVEKAMKYLAEVCKGGRFGSTQSTVLALKAIVEYDKSRAKPKAPGSLQLVVDGKAVGEPAKFTKETQGAIELPDFAAAMTPGKHEIQVKMDGGSDMPYSIAVEYNTLKPASAEACKVHLTTKLRDTQIDEGAVTEAQVVVVNRTGKPIPTPVAIVGIPGGLEVRHDQLKELVKAEKIAAYEVLGRDVVLYWRSLKAEQRVELPISLVAAIPGTYTGPASRAYLYYTDEHKHWNDGLKVEIAPRLAAR